jgi:DNA-binding transcriptional ArsR family regulator
LLAIYISRFCRGLLSLEVILSLAICLSIQTNNQLLMYTELDPVLNTPVRLAIVSILIKIKQSDFNYLMEMTNTTQGNLSHQIKKLNEAGYIEVIKTFKGSYPHTLCRLTKNGRKAFVKYVEDIKKYLHL